MWMQECDSLVIILNVVMWSLQEQRNGRLVSLFLQPVPTLVKPTADYVQMEAFAAFEASFGLRSD